ncbi:hypothetical protein ACVWYH_000369 [Bradyrhizobium sp. GM24.11]
MAKRQHHAPGKFDTSRQNTGMMASSRVRHTRAEQSGAGFFMSEEECHDQESLPPAAVIKSALPATSGLDLERWPRWMRDALAIQPETKAPEHPRIESGPVRVGPRKRAQTNPHPVAFLRTHTCWQQLHAPWELRTPWSPNEATQMVTPFISDLPLSARARSRRLAPSIPISAFW